MTLTGVIKDPASFSDALRYFCTLVTAQALQTFRGHSVQWIRGGHGLLSGLGGAWWLEVNGEI